MAKTKRSGLAKARKAKLRDAMEILRALGFAARQSNEVAAHTFLALLDLAATTVERSCRAVARNYAYH